MKKIILAIFLFAIIISSYIKFLLPKDNNVYSGVVKVDSVSEGKSLSGIGFVYKKENGKSYILTNYHVIKNSNHISITNFKGEKVDVKDYRYDDVYDVAILIIDDNISLKALRFSISDDDKIYLLNYDNKKYEGKIISYNEALQIQNEEDEYYYNALKVQVDVDYGNSGSPVVDLDFNVLGMMSVMNLEDSTGYAIPIADLLSIASKLENENYKKIVLGGKFSNYNNGVIVLDVVTDYPLYNSGIRENDVIVKVDDYDIKSIKDLKEYLNNCIDCYEINILYYRDNELMKTIVKVD